MPSGVYPRTEAHSFNLGRKHPNRKPYFKGKAVIPKTCAFCATGFTTDCYQPRKKYCSQSCRSKDHADVNRANLLKIDRTKQKAIVSQRRGTAHPRWIADRTQIVGRHVRQFHDGDYKQWRKAVCDRDSWKCKLLGDDCSGRLEVHHILTWKNHPDLRYSVDNGICLCHFHHPKTRADEERLAPVFQAILKPV